MSVLDRTVVSDKEYSDEEYSERRIHSIMTPMKTSIQKDPARIQYLVERILEVCRDTRSARFYGQVARALPDDVLFRFLSEIKADKKIRNRGAVFTAMDKHYLEKHR